MVRRKIQATTQKRNYFKRGDAVKTVAFQQKTLGLIQKINKIIDSYQTRLTVRQIYYQLVSSHTIENSLNEYKKFNKVLTDARKAKLVDSFRIVDRSKPIIQPSMWGNVSEFMGTVKDAYKKDVWETQPKYFEAWIEKDALSGVLEPITKEFGVLLAVGRGYQSFSNKKEAAQRFSGLDKETEILYFGDFDPSGLDISRDIEEQLLELGADITLTRIALTEEQIKEHNLPPIPTKTGDSRTANHVAKYGNVAVELDALPPNVLVALLQDAIEERIDVKAFNQTQQEQGQDLEKINKWINKVGDSL